MMCTPRIRSLSASARILTKPSVRPDARARAEAVRESRRVERHLGSRDEALVRDLLALMGDTAAGWIPDAPRTAYRD